MCVIAIAVLVRYQFGEIKVWQKWIMVFLSPLVIASLLIIFLCILPKHIKENGFHNILPRRKSKAYPLDKDDFRVWPKDIVAAGSEKMSIVDYNKKYEKSVALDDIYGQGYSESLTPEEIFECKVLIPKKFGLEPNMPDYIYKTVAIAFAKMFALSDVSFILPFVNDRTYITLYKKDELSGRQRILDYFTNWIDRADKDNLKVKVTVKWQPNQCRPAVYIKPDGYKEMVMLFRVQNNELTDIVLAPSLLQDYGCMFHDLDQPPYSVEFISNFIGEDEATQDNHLPCPICGTDSNLIDWYKFHIPMGPYTVTPELYPFARNVKRLLN